MDLVSKKCVPCQGGTAPLKGEELKKYYKEFSDWELFENDTKIRKEFVFNDFKSAINFVDKIAKIAEEEGHHPDLCLYDYKKVRVDLWTHKIFGLHENDFIMAAKINGVYNEMKRIDSL